MSADERTIREANAMTNSDVVIDDVQCGRCGSSMNWESCDGCDGGVYEIDDDDGMYEPEIRICPACRGKGGWWECLSDYGDREEAATWCAGSPLPGRINVPCSSVEEFTIMADGTTIYKRGTWAELIVLGEQEMRRDDA